MTLPQRIEVRRTYEALMVQYRTLEAKARTNADWEVAFDLLEQANGYGQQLKNARITLTGTVSGDLCFYDFQRKTGNDALYPGMDGRCTELWTVFPCVDGFVREGELCTLPHPIPRLEGCQETRARMISIF